MLKRAALLACAQQVGLCCGAFCIDAKRGWEGIEESRPFCEELCTNASYAAFSLDHSCLKDNEGVDVSSIAVKRLRREDDGGAEISIDARKHRDDLICGKGIEAIGGLIGNEDTGLCR